MYAPAQHDEVTGLVNYIAASGATVTGSPCHRP